MNSETRTFHPEEWLKGAESIVRKAGELLLAGPGGALSVEFKGDVDLVTEMDRRSERLVVEHLAREFPGTGILAEEGTGSPAGAPGTWILDPLDGTTNYAHGFPVYCVSLAFELEGTLELGLIYDPTRDEMFTARRGGGARLNGEFLGVSRCDRLGDSLLATGFPYDIRVSERNNLAQFNVMARRARGIRRAGAAALDLACVAAGRFDGYWEEKIAPWDVAAGILMVTEAGGVVTDYRGNAASPRGSEIVASNGRIHAAVLEVLAGLLS